MSAVKISLRMKLFAMARHKWEISDLAFDSIGSILQGHGDWIFRRFNKQ